MVKSSKMPDVKHFLDKKKFFSKKKEEVWVYLEREMKENIDKKPYNEQVGEWLKFLKDLRIYYNREAKKRYNRLTREVGPAWFIQFSTKQREVLQNLGDDIHKDVMEWIPRRTQKTLNELGMYMTIPPDVMLKVMKESREDPGVFLWYLYKEIYKTPPNILRRSYDLNAMIMMTSMLYLDYPQCLEALKPLTRRKPPPPQPEKPKQQKYSKPNEIYGVYMEKMYAPLVCQHPSVEELKATKPIPELENKLKLKSEESYENILKDTSFIEKRFQRNLDENIPTPVCNYKFWEPPPGTRCSDPKMIKYLIKLRMVKTKARAGYQVQKPAMDNVQFHVGSVVYAGQKPWFMLNSIVTIPTGYIPLHNGFVLIKTGELITHIGGHWKYPREVTDACDTECSCLKKWEPAVMKYLQESKCKCGHFYDYYNEGKSTEKYFYPPTSNLPQFFDYAKIYQTDKTEDVIKEAVKEALMSQEHTPQASEHVIDASVLTDSQLTSVFLADLADTPLLIPHLPEANLIPSLQAFVRKRVRGPIPPKQHSAWKIKSQRRWKDIENVDFRARAYFIPFTNKQLHSMSWAHRGLVQKLFKYLLADFTLRNQLKLVELSRLFYPTMMNDFYTKNDSSNFLDMFFTYFPARVQDTYIINPYNPNTKYTSGGKTCPLK